MLAELAQREGERVVAFDLFGDLDLRRGGAEVVTASSLTAVVEAALERPPSRVVYGASFENHPVLVERLAERHELLGNTPVTLRAVRDPFRLAAALRDAGFAVPRTYAEPPLERNGRFVRKPLRGGGGTRVRAWRGGRLPSGMVVQERVDGVVCSVAAVGDGVAAVVRGVSEQLVGRRAFGVRGFRWCGNITLSDDALLSQARALCSTLAAAFGLRGPFGVDFVWDGERAWTLEVNPRPTASLELFGLTRDKAAGKAVLFATEDVVVGDTEAWLDRGIRDVPHPGEHIASGRPVCTVLATADTPDEVLRRLETEAATLRADLAPGVAAP